MIVKMEFSRVVTCVRSWKLCRNGDGILSWVYAHANEISFSSIIEGNWVLAIEIEEEGRVNFAKS
jgi:hypothetical protein